MEDWAEALDLDEPDFPPILRPCTTRPRPFSVPAADADFTLPQLHPSSPPLQTLNNNNTSFPHQNPETLVVPSKRPRQLNVSGKAETLVDSQRSPVVSVQPRSIPGPAGVVLTALRRRRELESEEEMPVLSTQEYLRKAVDGDGGNSEFDDDFKKPSWVAALDYSGSAVVPLGSIKNCGTQKLPKVVAMIKILTPNGFGDFMATLKDPSGTISASIHRSVVIEGNYGSYLSVGAVLVLEKVSIFSTRGEYYLNIVHKNVVKIFPKDFESMSNSVSGSAAVSDCGGSVMKTPVVQNSSYAGTQLTNRGAANEVGSTVSSFSRQSTNEQQLQGNNSTKEAAFKSLRSIEKQNEPACVTTIPNNTTDINNKAQAAFRGGNYPSAVRHEHPGEANKMIHKASAAESNGANKQMQPVTSLSSLPQWTDEQLEELLVED